MAEAICSIEKCKQAPRAKGYCRVHYKKWRRGDLPHSRYNTCNHEACRKKVHLRGLCADHFAAKFGKKVTEAAAAPAPAAPVEAAAPQAEAAPAEAAS